MKLVKGFLRLRGLVSTRLFWGRGPSLSLSLCCCRQLVSPPALCLARLAVPALVTSRPGSPAGRHIFPSRGGTRRGNTGRTGSGSPPQRSGWSRRLRTWRDGAAAMNQVLHHHEPHSEFSLEQETGFCRHTLSRTHLAPVHPGSQLQHFPVLWSQGSLFLQWEHFSRQPSP